MWPLRESDFDLSFADAYCHEELSVHFQWELWPFWSKNKRDVENQKKLGELSPGPKPGPRKWVIKGSGGVRGQGSQQSCNQDSFALKKKSSWFTFPTLFSPAVYSSASYQGLTLRCPLHRKRSVTGVTPWPPTPGDTNLVTPLTLSPNTELWTRNKVRDCRFKNRVQWVKYAWQTVHGGFTDWDKH